MLHSFESIIKEIQLLSESMLRNNPLFNSLRKRPPNKRELSLYLANVHRIICNTQPNLRSALIASTQNFNKPLAEYFFEKIFEEIGHEKWAEQDRCSNQLSSSETPTKAVLELADFLDHISAQQPLQYAVYILANEYLTANYGSQALELFRAKPQQENMLSVISNHVELDVEHANDDEKKLKYILNTITTQELDQIMKTIKNSFRLINQSFVEIYESNSNHARSAEI